MKLKNLISILIFCLALSLFSYAAPDLKFITNIELIPVNPGLGDNVEVKVRFRCVGGTSSNVKVIGGIDGSTIYNHTFPTLGYNETNTISFNWIATGGNHTAFFKIDPNKTSNDTNFNNNIVTKGFNARSLSA